MPWARKSWLKTSVKLRNQREYSLFRPRSSPLPEIKSAEFFPLILRILKFGLETWLIMHKNVTTKKQISINSQSDNLYSLQWCTKSTKFLKFTSTSGQKLCLHKALIEAKHRCFQIMVFGHLGTVGVSNTVLDNSA